MSLIFEKALLRQAYENTTAYLSRLAAFATSAPISGDTDVLEKQDILCVDDLVFFAVSARRFLDISQERDVAFEVKIPGQRVRLHAERPLFYDVGDAFSVWDILNVVIHCRGLMIFRNDLQIRGMYYSFDELMKRFPSRFSESPYARTFSPKIFMESQHKKIFCDLRFLIETFSAEVLSVCLDRLEDRKVYLRSLYDVRD